VRPGIFLLEFNNRKDSVGPLNVILIPAGKSGNMEKTHG
jgi:hypothetical protein